MYFSPLGHMEVVFKVTENWAFKSFFQGEETQLRPAQLLLLVMYEEKQHFILQSQMCESLSTFETNCAIVLFDGFWLANSYMVGVT